MKLINKLTPFEREQLIENLNEQLADYVINHSHVMEDFLSWKIETNEDAVAAMLVAYGLLHANMEEQE